MTLQTNIAAFRAIDTERDAALARITETFLAKMRENRRNLERSREDKQARRDALRAAMARAVRIAYSIARARKLSAIA